MNELSPPPDNGVLVHEHPVDHQSVQTPVQSKGRAGRTLLAFLVITFSSAPSATASGSITRCTPR
jgi:hypothetical protein